MANTIIPVTSANPAYTMDVLLGEVEYAITMRWNERDGAWYMDIASIDGTIIVAGRRIVVDWDLLRTCHTDDRPTGRIMAIDTTGEGDPGRYDLGTRVQLVYAEDD